MATRARETCTDGSARGLNFVAKKVASSEVWEPPPRQTTSWHKSSLVTKKRTKASKIMPSLFLRYISTMFLKDQDDQDDANERTQVVVPPGLQAPAPKKN